MTARFLSNEGKPRGHRPRLQLPGLYANCTNRVYDRNVRTPGHLSRRQLIWASVTLPLTFFGCGRKPQKSEQQVVDLYIQSDGDFLAFKPDELTCLTGTLVRLRFHHAGKFLSARHNWVLAQQDQMEAVDKDAEKTEGVVSIEDPRVIAFV